MQNGKTHESKYLVERIPQGADVAGTIIQEGDFDHFRRKREKVFHKSKVRGSLTISKAGG
jgi:hypothetical protein